MAFRDGPFENLKVPLAWTAAVVAVVAMAGAALLLVSDRTTPDGGSSYGAARGAAASVTGPVSGVFAAPVRWVGAVTDYIGGYFFAVSENRRLRAEVAELEPWRDQAIALKNVNARYGAMLGLRTEPAVPMVTARAISDARGPFNRAKLVDVGASKGVRIGNPVINEHGLIGRVTGVTGGVSRMVLLTDVASRTPVLVDRTDARALLTGDGSDNPRLEFVRGAGSVQAGDRILSSGDGGGLPRGIPIGVAAKGIDGSWRVKLFSDRGAIDYVRVLLFQDFGQLIDPNALNAPPLAGLTTAPPPNAEQAGAIGDAAARRQAAAEAQAARARAAAAVAATPPATTPAAPQARPVQTRPAQPRPAAEAPSAATSPQPTPAQAPEGVTVRRPVAVRVVGPLQWIVYPALAAIAATIIFATPVQLFGLMLPEPVFPMVLAFAWPLIRPSMTAPAVLFGLGLFLDLFWNGPLGLWALCLMGVYVVILLSRNLLAGHEGVIRFAWYMACTLAAFLVAYVIVAVRAGNPPAILALIGQILPTLILYPIADWMLERFDDGDIRFR